LAVNGKHFAAFRHRLPYAKIKGIEVKGDVSDIQVDQIHVDKYPEISDREVLDISCSNAVKMPVKSGRLLPVPCYGRLTENFTHGKRLHIKGRIKILPHSFFLNLQQGSYIWPHPQIAFHFNARFGNVGGRHLICSNSWLNGKWDKELRSECCHFMPGKEFYLVVACEESSFQIYLNDVLIQEYQHRCEPRMIDTLYIQGDIQLQNVFMENTFAYN
jgi:Galactoside-binding lectin